MKTTDNYRREIRTLSDFKVFVRLNSGNGQRVKIHTAIDNISSSGLFMRLPQQVDVNTQLFSFIRMSNKVGLATVGKVVRTEKKTDGLIGTAVCFSKSRLLSLEMS